MESRRVFSWLIWDWSEAQSLSKLERCDLLLLLTVMRVTWQGKWMETTKLRGMFGFVFFGWFSFSRESLGMFGVPQFFFRSFFLFGRGKVIIIKKWGVLMGIIFRHLNIETKWKEHEETHPNNHWGRGGERNELGGISCICVLLMICTYMNMFYLSLS